MSVRQILLAFTALLASGSVYWCRTSLANMKRTTQTSEYINTSPDGSGLRLKALQRSNPADKFPQSVTFASIPPFMLGEYKNTSGGPPPHIHLYAEDKIKVTKGRMGLLLGTEEKELHEGETIAVPPGTIHTFWNADPANVLEGTTTETQFKGPTLPYTSERFFEQLAGIGYDYGGLHKANKLQLLVTYHGFGHTLGVPLPVRLFMRYFLVPFAKHVLGFKEVYPEYMMP